MKDKLIYILIIAVCLFSYINGQVAKNENTNSNNLVKDNALGISFAKVGAVKLVDNSSYSIKLSSENSSIQNAIAKISTSDRLFVDLPGSYGGRLFLDSPGAANLLKDRVKVDSFSNGQQNFKREYWAVYAGMGMWDCVINCYSQKEGKYYIISFIEDKQFGKPGVISNGKQLKAEDIKMKILSSLQDTTNNNVKEFNNLVASFQILN